jgi:hypothetical protein
MNLADVATCNAPLIAFAMPNSCIPEHAAFQLACNFDGETGSK